MPDTSLPSILFFVFPLAIKVGEAIIQICKTELAVELKSDKNPLNIADVTTK